MLAIEEMSELIKELLKNINRGKNNPDEIFEEVADVAMMLEYLKSIYGITDERIWEYENKKTVEKWLPKIEKMKSEKDG